MLSTRGGGAAAAVTKATTTTKTAAAAAAQTERGPQQAEEKEDEDEDEGEEPAEEELLLLRDPAPSAVLALQEMVESLCLLLGSSSSSSKIEGGFGYSDGGSNTGVGRRAGGPPRSPSRGFWDRFSSSLRSDSLPHFLPPAHQHLLHGIISDRTRAPTTAAATGAAAAATPVVGTVTLSRHSTSIRNDCSWSSNSSSTSSTSDLVEGEERDSDGLVALTTASQLCLSLWPPSMSSMSSSSSSTPSSLLSILYSLGAVLPHVHTLGPTKVIAALRVSRCLLISCPAETRRTLLVNGEGGRPEGVEVAMEGEGVGEGGSAAGATSDAAAATCSLLGRFQGSKIKSELLLWAAEGGRKGVTEGGRHSSSCNNSSRGVTCSNNRSGSRGPPPFLGQLMGFIDYLGKQWREIVSPSFSPSNSSNDNGSSGNMPVAPSISPLLFRMTTEALTTLLVLAQDHTFSPSSLPPSFSSSSSRCWASTWLSGPSLPFLLDGALRIRDVELVDLCIQLLHCLSQSSGAFFDQMAKLRGGGFLPEVACRVLDWHLEVRIKEEEGRQGGRAEKVGRSNSRSFSYGKDVHRLCLRLIRLLSRVCASYGTTGVHLFLRIPLRGPPGTNDNGSSYSDSYRNNEGGKKSGDRLLPLLVRTVHQEVEGLLTRRGQGGVRLRRMLARESFALLSLLSANHPGGVIAGLNGSGCRWTLEAVNFRLMNRLVEGLEDLMEDAENLSCLPMSDL